MGPVFAPFLKKIKATHLLTFQAEPKPENELPSKGNSLFAALLPVLLLVSTTALTLDLPKESSFTSWIYFLADPGVVMRVFLLYATFSIGLLRKTSMSDLMEIYTVATKDIAMILLIVAGALKPIFTAAGVNQTIAENLHTWEMPPLMLAWLITSVIRVGVG